MSAKAGFPSALVLIALGLSTAPGQNPPAQTGTLRGGGAGQTTQQAPELLPAPGASRETAPAPGPMAEVLTPPGVAPPAPPAPSPAVGLSNWINYTRPGCCTPVGGDGPIQIELYARTGPSLVVGGGVLNNILDNGWEVIGGGRSLFFNPEMSAAFTIDLSLGYIYNHARAEVPIPIQLTTPPPVPPGGTPPPVNFTQARLRALHRTNVGISLGREWFYTYQGDNWKLGWRFGFDVGGTMGSSRADFVNIPHRTDIPFGLVTAVHTDFEVPRGCCTLVTGLRVEWDHDWTDILQTQNNGNISDLNVLWSIGVRY